MNQNEKSAKLQGVVNSDGLAEAGRFIVEAVLDFGEEASDIAADFIEDEIGRHDWMYNWHVIKKKEDPMAKIQHYLDTYGLVADAGKIVEIIDRMALDNPGLWK